MHDSRFNDDGISQRPDIQEHIFAISELKKLIGEWFIIGHDGTKAIKYAIEFLENSTDDFK